MLVTSPEMVEENRRFNAQLEALLATEPSLHTVDPVVTRRNRLEGKGIFPKPEVVAEGQDRTIRGRAGDIPLRVFVPEVVNGVYLHIHGGGWVLGSAAGQDVLLWRLARNAGVAVVSVDYRLAPEHPYPAGPDDCEDAALWLVDQCQAEFGTDRLVIGGESGGAHLSAVTLLRLRDKHGAAGAYRGANLVYGAYDLSQTPSQRRWGDRNLVLSGPIVRWFLEQFLPGVDPEARRDPDISPLYADLTGMPAACFSVGTMDMLLDDNLFMEARWRMTGAPTEIHIYEEAAHAFNLFPIMAAELTNGTQAAFVAKAVGA